MAVTLCVPPRAGELCAPVRFLVRKDSVVMELTARHRITSVEWDERERAVAMVVEITDPQTARPVDVRIDVVGRRCGARRRADHDDRHHRARRATIRRRRHLSRRRRRRKLKRREDRAVEPRNAPRRSSGCTTPGRAAAWTARPHAAWHSKAIRGALDDAGLSLDDVDGISAGPLSTALIYDLRLGPAWQGLGFGVGMITEAVTAIEHGMADVVVLVAAQAGEYRDHEATAPWTTARERIRRAVGHVHHRRVRAHRATAHARLRHDARTTVHRRGDHPQQRIAKPRSRLLPTRSVHARTTSPHPGPSPTRSICSTAPPPPKADAHWWWRTSKRSTVGAADRSTCWAAARTSTARPISTHRRGTSPAGAD